MSSALQDGHRSGATFDARLDGTRLNTQARKVWDVMSNGHWLTLAALETLTGYPQASISARLRDFRKKRFGGHDVLHVRSKTGQWWYKLEPRCVTDE